MKSLTLLIVLMFSVATASYGQGKYHNSGVLSFFYNVQRCERAISSCNSLFGVADDVIQESQQQAVYALYELGGQHCNKRNPHWRNFPECVLRDDILRSAERKFNYGIIESLKCMCSNGCREFIFEGIHSELTAMQIRRGLRTNTPITMQKQKVDCEVEGW